MDVLGATVALFLVMDPLGNLPVFLSVLQSVPEAERRRVLVRELLVALLVLQVFLFAGQYLMDVFHFSSEAIGIGGGIVLLLIAIRMIFPARGGALGDAPEAAPSSCRWPSLSWPVRPRWRWCCCSGSRTRGTRPSSPWRWPAPGSLRRSS